MGYTRTPTTIKKVELLLQEMVDSDESIEWIFNNPVKIQYQIHQAINYAVKSGKEEFKKYSTLMNKYKIRVVQPDIVKAERRVHYIRPNGVVVRDVNDVLEIIGAAIYFKEDKIIFPEITELKGKDLETLTNWSLKNSYSFKFDNNRLELVKNDN